MSGKWSYLSDMSDIKAKQISPSIVSFQYFYVINYSPPSERYQQPNWKPPLYPGVGVISEFLRRNVWDISLCMYVYIKCIVIAIITNKKMWGVCGFFGDKGNEAYLKINWNLIYISNLYDFFLFFYF